VTVSLSHVLAQTGALSYRLNMIAVLCEIIRPTKISFVDENRKLFKFPLYNQNKELDTLVCSFTQEVF